MTRDIQFSAIIGDLDHRKDVFLYCGVVNNAIVDKYISNQAITNWVRTNAPGLVPGDDPAGLPPSAHTIASIFRAHYNEPAFRVLYLSKLREDDVRNSSSGN